MDEDWRKITISFKEKNPKEVWVRDCLKTHSTTPTAYIKDVLYKHFIALEAQTKGTEQSPQKSDSVVDNFNI